MSPVSDGARQPHPHFFLIFQSQARASILTASQLASYNDVKARTAQLTGWGEGPALHFTSSMVAGLVSTTATSPGAGRQCAVEANCHCGHVLRCSPCLPQDTSSLLSRGGAALAQRNDTYECFRYFELS